MNFSLTQHRSLQPTGPPTQGAVPQHSHTRLVEALDSIRQEFDLLASDMTIVRSQRDDYEGKGESLRPDS